MLDAVEEVLRSKMVKVSRVSSLDLWARCWLLLNPMMRNKVLGGRCLPARS